MRTTRARNFLKRGFRWITLACGIAGLLALFACTGLWNTVSEPTLVIGHPVFQGGQGYILLSVTNMPESGVATLAIEDLGYANMTDVRVEGEGGFLTLFEEFVGGQGTFLVAHPINGIRSGKIAKLIFQPTGVPSITFGPTTDVTLGSGTNDHITAQIDLDPGYYAGGGS